MAAQPDPATQRRQAALFMSGIDCGGLDGIPGDKTTRGMEEFAKRTGIDPKDKAAINAALDARIADPEVRDRFVRIISSTPKPSKDDITALQWCLKEDGKRDMSASITTAGLMDGVRGDETNGAMRDSRRRAPTVAELERFYPGGATAYNTASLISVARNFHEAAAGQVAAVAPAVAPAPQERSPSLVAQWLTPGGTGNR